MQPVLRKKFKIAAEKLWKHISVVIFKELDKFLIFILFKPCKKCILFKSQVAILSESRQTGLILWSNAEDLSKDLE